MAGQSAWSWAIIAMVLVSIDGIKASIHHDPEIDMTADQIIAHWGYPVQMVDVTTADGYILQMHRIPYGKNGPGKSPRPVVFFQHGLESSSSDWITNLPHQSAGFIFADAGFDVWLGNFRGNTYGKRHIYLHPYHNDFWQWSFDQMAQNDLEAMINLVLNMTGQDSLYYVGHSQGTLTMFTKLATDMNFHTKIKKFFALAPVGSVKHIKGLLEYVAKFLYPEFELLFDIFGAGEFLPSNWITKIIAEFVCGNLFGNPLCDSVLFLIGGPNSNQLNMTRVPVYVAHAPAGTSTQNILHWAQMVLTGFVEMYDYRITSENQAHYNMTRPPLYDFTRINGNIYLYWSDADWLADKQDIQGYLLPNLNPSVVKANVELSDFNHFDFIWGTRAPAEVYAPILETIANDSIK